MSLNNLSRALIAYCFFTARTFSESVFSALMYIEVYNRALFTMGLWVTTGHKWKVYSPYLMVTLFLLNNFSCIQGTPFWIGSYLGLVYRFLYSWVCTVLRMLFLLSHDCLPHTSPPCCFLAWRCLELFVPLRLQEDNGIWQMSSPTAVWNYPILDEICFIPSLPVTLAPVTETTGFSFPE